MEMSQSSWSQQILGQGTTDHCDLDYFSNSKNASFYKTFCALPNMCKFSHVSPLSSPLSESNRCQQPLQEQELVCRLHRGLFHWCSCADLKSKLLTYVDGLFHWCSCADRSMSAAASGTRTSVPTPSKIGGPMSAAAAGTGTSLPASPKPATCR